ncbi:hypothetical protein TcCL_Unassigned03784 [Trypanosoma cruzi]|nr:hypothetical protein TcCL_Unassigned03784 [Trypanosoma cruzi]
MLRAWHGEGRTQKRDTAWDVNLHCSDRHRIRICSHLLRSLLPHFCAEDCAAGSGSAMFGRRNMARTNDFWEGDVHCDEKEENAARRPPRQGRSEVLFCPLARGRPATWSVGRIIIFASLRLLFIPLRFHADLRREICKKFLRGVRAVVGEAESPLKNATL